MWLQALCLTLLLCPRNSLASLIGNSSVRLHIRLVSYQNPANILISGAKCDSGASQCDPAFDVTARWSGRDVHLATPCLVNTDQINFNSHTASEAGSSIPTWAMVSATVRDCLFNELQDTVAEFQLNLTSQSGSTLFGDGSVVGTFEMEPIRLTPESIKLSISVWAQCSPGFYGDRCDRRCYAGDFPGDGKVTVKPDCASLSAPAATAATAPADTRAPSGRGGGGSDDTTKASMMFAAVMASSIISILFLTIIVLVAIRMCKASESNAIVMRRLASQQDGASLDSLQQKRYQMMQQSSFSNPAAYNCTLTPGSLAYQVTAVTNATVGSNRADSGVYEDPPEPPSQPTPPPPSQPPVLPPREREDVQRMPQSKSYSRRAN